MCGVRLMRKSCTLSSQGAPAVGYRILRTTRSRDAMRSRKIPRENLNLRIEFGHRRSVRFSSVGNVAHNGNRVALRINPAVRRRLDRPYSERLRAGMFVSLVLLVVFGSLSLFMFYGFAYVFLCRAYFL